MSSTLSKVTSGKDTGPFVDVTGRSHQAPALWEPYIITREEIDAEINRLASLPRPGNGRRRSLIIHPAATSPGLGLAAGIQVSLDVLLPGESTAPIRHNSTQVNFCIRGGGHTIVNGRRVVWGPARGDLNHWRFETVDLAIDSVGHGLGRLDHHPGQPLPLQLLEPDSLGGHHVADVGWRGESAFVPA